MLGYFLSSVRDARKADGQATVQSGLTGSIAAQTLRDSPNTIGDIGQARDPCLIYYRIRLPRGRSRISPLDAAMQPNLYRDYTIQYLYEQQHNDLPPPPLFLYALAKAKFFRRLPVLG